MPITLSAVIITLNEEKNIERCLLSLEEVADEIIIVDSGSTDQTVTIAEVRGAKVFKHSWEGYSGNKNFGNDQAQSDYIFSIDADEVVSEDLKSSLLNFKQNPKSSIASVNRRTNYCGYWVKYCGWYPDQKIRLFKRGDASWEGVIHENLVFENDTPVHLKGDLLHYSFPSISSHVKTADRFSDVAAQDLFKSGRKANMLMHLIMNPTFTFLKKYFINLGFLDGYYGFVICYLSAFSNFLKYSKLISLRRGSNLN